MDNNREDTGQRIRRIRGKMTQEEFGDLFGKKKGVVSKYENNETIPPPEALRIIARYGNTTVDYILNGEEKEKPTTVENGEMGLADIDTFIDSLAALSNAKKMVAKELVRMSDEDVLEWYLAHLRLKNNHEDQA